MKNITFCFPLIFLFLFSFPAFAHPIDMDAIAEIESSNNPNAIGSSGEIGLYQISPTVLKQFNQSHDRIQLEPFNEHSFTYEDVLPGQLKNPFVNLQIADWYMNWLLDRCWTEFDSIVAWNRGIGRWRNWRESGAKWGDLPETTKKYIEKYARLTNKTIVELGYEKI